MVPVNGASPGRARSRDKSSELLFDLGVLLQVVDIVLKFLLHDGVAELCLHLVEGRIAGVDSLMMCQPYWVWIGSLVMSPFFKVFTASPKGLTMRAVVNQPRSPPLVFELSVDSAFATSSNFAPPLIFLMSCSAFSLLGTRMCSA